MKRIITILVFVLALVASTKAQYNPVLHTVSNKAYGPAQSTPTDARSYFYDAVNFVYRPYVSTSEVLTYLNQARYRTGQFDIVINSGGTLLNGVITGGTNAIWYFKDGTADANLVLKLASTAGIYDSVTMASHYYVDTVKANLRTSINGKLQNTLATGKIWIGDINGNAQQQTPTGDVTIGTNGVTVLANKVNPIAGANMQITGTYPNFTFTGLTAPLNPTQQGLMRITGTYPNITFFSDTTGFEQSIRKQNATSQADSINLGINRFKFWGTSSLGIPSGNTVQRPSAPQVADMRFNTDSLFVEVWNGSVWSKLTPGAAGTGGMTQLTGDVTATGSGSVVATLATVNSNIYAANTFLKLAVNGKGLVTSAAPVAAADITGALGFTPIAVGATAGGDLSGTYPNPGVIKIQGIPVSSTVPTTGYGLIYNGTQWAPTSMRIAPLDSLAKNINGLQVVGGNIFVPQSADASFPGMVTTGSQTWAGLKTFNGGVYVPSVNGYSLISPTAFQNQMANNTATDTTIATISFNGASDAVVAYGGHRYGSRTYANSPRSVIGFSVGKSAVSTDSVPSFQVGLASGTVSPLLTAGPTTIFFKVDSIGKVYAPQLRLGTPGTSDSGVYRNATTGEFFYGSKSTGGGGTTYTFPQSVVAPSNAIQLKNDSSVTTSRFSYMTQTGRNQWDWMGPMKNGSFSEDTGINKDFIVEASAIMRPVMPYTYGQVITYNILGSPDSHANSFVDSIKGDPVTLGLYYYYPTVRRVMNTTIVADESFASFGAQMGASVDMMKALCQVYQPTTLGFRLTGNGTATWVTSGAIANQFTISTYQADGSTGFSSPSGGWTIDPYPTIITYVGKNNYHISRIYSGLGSYQVKFVLNDQFGNPVTANPTANDEVVVQNAGMWPSKINMYNFDATNSNWSTNTNLWMRGLFEAWMIVDHNDATSNVVRWQNKYPNATQYKIYRDISPTFATQTLIYTGTGNRFFDTGLTTGTLYYYKMVATVSSVDQNITTFKCKTY